MTTTYDDTHLVATHLAGDPAAFAAIYDRFSDSLYDTASAMLGDRHAAADIVQDVFLIAAERLDQLRDPTRLKPWLFAIMRNEVYRHTRQRRREVAIDFSEPGAELSAPQDPGDDGAGAEYEELAELVRTAARGLDARDQLVLELSVRQGLQGADLADALGVSAQQSYGLLHRMRERTERSLGALCVARVGRKECPELAEILQSWDGEFSVLIRKRVARHIDACDICERTKRRFAPLVLLGSAKAMAAPIDLRDRVLGRASLANGDTPSYAFTRPGGFPTVTRRARRLAFMLGLATIAVLVFGGVTAYVIADGDGSDMIATADAGSLAISGELDTTDPDVRGAVVEIEAATTGTGSVAAAAPGATTPAVTTTSTTPAETTTTTIDVESAAALPPSPSDTTPSPANPSPVAPVPVDPAPVDPEPVDPAPVDPAPTTEPTTTATTTVAPTTTIPPPPGTLTLDTTVVDLGASTRSRTVTLTNQGGQPVTFGVKIGALFAVSPTAGVIPPGESMALTVSVDRSPPAPEGSIGTTATLVPLEAGVANASMSLLATVERQPVVVVDGPPTPGYCPRVGAINASVRALVTDESPPLKVALRATEPGGKAFVAPMSPDGPDRWSASLQLPPIPGSWQWHVDAADDRGNVGSQGGKFAVDVDYC